MYKILCVIVSAITCTSVSARSKGHLNELYKTVNNMRECFYEEYIGVCLKEKALEALNQTTLSNEPIVIGILRIEKSKDYNWNHTLDLPTDLQKRSTKLTDILWEKIYEFFRSRTVRFNLWDAVEGRGKKGGGLGGKGTMTMMACAGAGMMVGKMGMMAAGAMMMSKLALLMTLIMLLKKSKGGGGGDEGGEEKKIKIVYASSGGGGDYGKGGGGGGWHRSMSGDSHSVAYRAHSPSENSNVVYEDKAKDASNRRCDILVDRRVGTEIMPSI